MLSAFSEQLANQPFVDLHIRLLYESAIIILIKSNLLWYLLLINKVFNTNKQRCKHYWFQYLKFFFGKCGVYKIKLFVYYTLLRNKIDTMKYDLIYILAIDYNIKNILIVIVVALSLLLMYKIMTSWYSNDVLPHLFHIANELYKMQYDRYNFVYFVFA